MFIFQVSLRRNLYQEKFFLLCPVLLPSGWKKVHQVSTCHLGTLVLVTAWFILGPFVLALTRTGSLAVVPFILLKDGNTHITSTLLWHGRQSLATSSAREMCTAFISSVTAHFHYHLNGQGHFALSLFFSSVKFDRIGHVLLELSFSPQDSASSSPFPRMSPSPPHQGRHLHASSLMTLFLHFDPRTPHSFLSLTCCYHFSCSSSHPPPGMFCLAISWMFPRRGPTGPSHWRRRTLTSFSPSHHLCLLMPSFPSVIPRDRTYAEDHPAALPDSPGHKSC